MAKKRLIKIAAMAFAIALLVVCFVPALPAFAEEAPDVSDVLAYYPMQEYILTFDFDSSANGFEPASITIPLSYLPLESLEVPVLTSDGSMTVNVKWRYDLDFGISYEVDLSELAEYIEITDYKLIAITPGFYDDRRLLATIACDAPSVTYTWEYYYLYPEITSTPTDAGTDVQYLFNSKEAHLTVPTDSEWMTAYFYSPFHDSGQVFGGATFITTSEISISASEPITTLQFAVPCFDADSNPNYFYGNLLWGWEYRDTYAPPVILPESVDTTEWFGDMAQNLLKIQLFPGITFGGLLVAFIAIPMVVVFLKLFAGG